MARLPLDDATRTVVERLADATFAGRDELCAAADQCAEDAPRGLCRATADRLGGHGAELQQVLLAHGVEPTIPEDKLGPASERFARVAAQRGTFGLMVAAEGCAIDIEKEYNRALRVAAGAEIRGMLAKQRTDVVSDREAFQQRSAKQGANIRRPKPSISRGFYLL